MICWKGMLICLVLMSLVASKVAVVISVHSTLNDVFSAKVTTEPTDLSTEEVLGKKVECNCGNWSTSCEFRDSKKVCTCKTGYAQGLDGYCKECNCGFWSKSCNLSVTEEKICTCNFGYLPREGICTECSCGSKGYCRFEGKNKVCECKYGYKDINGFCQVCDCGENGRCTFEQVSGFVRKECYCLQGYVEFGGHCEACFCGVNGNCTLNHEGRKDCECEFGYGPISGTCEPCGCNPGNKCIFDKTTKRCHCPKGFEDVQALCKDINECLNPEVCPSSMNCINKPGSYDCVCKEGYEKSLENVKSNEEECKDIDECVTLATPCPYESAICVNTPGSYRCDCKKGYYPLVTPGPKVSPRYNVCLKESSSINITGIVVGCLCGGLIFGIVMFIWKERMKSLRNLRHTTH